MSATHRTERSDPTVLSQPARPPEGTVGDSVILDDLLPTALCPDGTVSPIVAFFRQHGCSPGCPISAGGFQSRIRTEGKRTSLPAGERTDDNRAWPSANQRGPQQSFCLNHTAARPTYTSSPSHSRSTPPETAQADDGNQKPAGNSSSSVPTPTHTHNTTTHHALSFYLSLGPN